MMLILFCFGDAQSRLIFFRNQHNTIMKNTRVHKSNSCHDTLYNNNNTLHDDLSIVLTKQNPAQRS